MPTTLLHSRPARAAALAATTVLALGAATAPTVAAAHHTAQLRKAPVIVAHMGHQIRLSRDSVRAGQVTFEVRTATGTHELQIARLRHGYTLQQAGADINKAFSGDVAAVNRVDHGVDFRGGAEAKPGKPGEYTTSLGRGHYLALDQDGNGLAFLTVYGAKVQRAVPATSSTIGVFTYGFDAPHSMPHTGTTFIFNRSDQPHFVEMQRIKAGTTRAQIKQALSPANMNSGRPPWARGANTSTGVLTNGRSLRFHYDLPPGKYLIACFWPDDETGMPHAFMGMWDVVWLR